jgi:hypothetical protein
MIIYNEYNLERTTRYLIPFLINLTFLGSLSYLIRVKGGFFLDQMDYAENALFEHRF